MMPRHSGGFVVVFAEISSAEANCSILRDQSRMTTGLRVRWCGIMSPPRWCRPNQWALCRRLLSLSWAGLRNVCPPKVLRLR